MTREALLRFIRLLSRFRKDIVIPLALLVCAGGVLAFIEIASEVEEREFEHYDRAILLGMREPGNAEDPIGPKWMEETGRDLTALGGFTILTCLTVASIGMMLLLGKPRLAMVTAIAILGGMMASDLLKQTFARTRPDLVPHGMVVTSASFPSGHSMMAAVVYLTLGVLLARTQPNKWVRVYLIGISTVITVLVGISRVYLGVHWPTDVLGGWILGVVWALLFWVITTRVDPVKAT
jgi:undecaprenyl-diphosphatase